MKNPYEDMLHFLPPVSEKHAKMSMLQRAAQFSPFAALTGYEAVIAETGRLTEPLRELDDNRKEVLDGCLQRLQQCITQHPISCRITEKTAAAILQWKGLCKRSTVTGESFCWRMDLSSRSTAFLKFMIDKRQKPTGFPSVFCQSFSFLL